MYKFAVWVTLKLAGRPPSHHNTQTKIFLLKIYIEVKILIRELDYSRLLKIVEQAGCSHTDRIVYSRT